MKKSQIKDQLAWDKFFEESSKRETYPPKKIELFNRLMAYTNNFFVVAAIGAISPGYIMIITKELIPSISMVENKHIDELKWLIEVISKAIRKTYNKETLPTLDHYRNQNILYEIEGNGDIREIYKEIKQIIHSLET